MWLRVQMLLGLGLCLADTAAAQEAPAEWIARQQLPRWAEGAVVGPTASGQYVLDLDRNPFFVTGDFDGDALEDVAIRVRDRATGAAGLAIVFRRAPTAPVVVAAGAPSPRGPANDMRATDILRADSAAAYEGHQSQGPVLLYLEKSESANGLLWWDGTRFAWTQRGD